MRVEDTGVGASPEALAAADGVGIRNTDERLRLLFGTGLDVEADRPVGFAVSFRLPLPAPPERVGRRVAAAPPVATPPVAAPPVS